MKNNRMRNEYKPCDPFRFFYSHIIILDFKADNVYK